MTQDSRRHYLSDERADIELLKAYYTRRTVMTPSDLEPIWHLILLQRINVKMDKGHMYVLTSAAGKHWVEQGFDAFTATLGRGHGIATGVNLAPAQRAPEKYNK